MFDVFYFGPKPNLFPHEQYAATIEEAAAKSQTKLYWYVYSGNDYSDFDFTWQPDKWEESHLHVFPSQWQADSNTYLINKHTVKDKQWHYRDSQKVTRSSDLDIFFVDKNNAAAQERFSKIKERYPKSQKVRFANSMFDTVKRCLNRTTTDKFWVISSENVYDNFNFEWHSQPWQSLMSHVFGSQWQKWSDTFQFDKRELGRHVTWAKTIEELPNLNFVSDQKVALPDDLCNIYYVDHFNELSQLELDKIKRRFPTVRTTRFVNNYLDTIKRILTTATTDYIWVISSICDYTKFDFTWQPEPWQGKMLHVFPSNEQKFGDTFYIHVPSLKEQINKLELLEWFETVNFCNEQVVPRLPMDQVYFNSDSIVSAIQEHTFVGPYTLFQCISDDAILYNKHTPSIWRKKDRSIHVLAEGGSVCVVPRDAKTEIKSQCYDYPYIMRHRDAFYSEKPLDIVYISNGEPDAERWYNHLVSCAPGRTIHWIKDVNGRAAAYRAAANASTTPWFFTVFAKLEVNPEFDWSWQPDRLQEPKSYVFHAKNPVNGLEYGHQALICYNKKLVLETDEHGLDFTLSKAHEVVPILSGTAHFNVDQWTTWRTSFRETLKLKEYAINKPNDINAEYRLSVWRTKAEGKNAEWSLAGANDAIQYYNEVNGDMDKLMLSFEWAFLKELFNSKYKTV